VENSCTPVKTKILQVWLTIENRMLTWDNGLKRGWAGPGRCALCKVESKYVQNLFILCHFVQHVMSENLKLLSLHGPTLLRNILEWLKTWKVNPGTKDFPIFMVYFIWWALNTCIFQDVHIPLKKVSPLIVKLWQVKGELFFIFQILITSKLCIPLEEVLTLRQLSAL
jgi:hypothetical protein